MNSKLYQQYLNENHDISYLDWLEIKAVSKKKGKKIEQFTKLGELVSGYNSIAEASRKTGISRSAISMCLNAYKGKKSCGGFWWKFKNEN